MKNKSAHTPIARLVPMVATLAGGMVSALASPYATCLTNNAGVISFRLNQTNAQVQVIYNGGAAVTNLGPLPQGLTVTNLGISGNFKVKVTGNAAPGYVKISDDLANINRFANARGLAVNKRPGSPYFGRIYVCNNGGGVVGTRTTTAGFYLLNSDDTDAVGQGDTGLIGGYNPYPGGLVPWKVSVGKDDDNIYGAGRDVNYAGVFVADPNITTMTNALYGIYSSGYPILTNFHGSINGVWVEGSQAGGDLKMYVNDEDYEESSPQRNSLWRYDIGATPFPYHPDSNNIPITHLFTPQINAGNQAFNDVVRGGVSNYFYVMQVASSGFQAGIYVLDADGNELTNSLSITTNLTGDVTSVDIMKTSQALDISWDGKYLINLRGLVSSVAQPAELITLTTNGLIDLTITNKLWLGLQSTSSSQSGAANRDVSFDAAGNLYNVSSSTALQALRIWARGGYTIATTGSDGSYTFEEPPVITGITLINNGSQAQIDFTGPITAGAWYYKLGASSTIDGTYTDTADTVTRLSSGVFRVTTSVSPGGNQFFRIHQL